MALGAQVSDVTRMILKQGLIAFIGPLTAEPIAYHGFQVLLHKMYVSCMARRSSGVHSTVRSFSDL